MLASFQASPLDVAQAMDEARGTEPTEFVSDQLRSGDQEAFRMVFERLCRPIFSFILGFVGDPSLAEDLTQETFIRAYRGLKSMRGEARLSTWLHQIAVTRAINHLDRSAEKVSRAGLSISMTGERSPSDDGDPGVAPPLRDDSSPLQALEAAELRRRLALCLERLPAAWRAALALREAEGLSYEDIARAAGIPVGTVRSRLARARTALRECIEGAQA